MSVDRPRVDIEIAGTILKSRRIDVLSKYNNFPQPLQYFDLVGTVDLYCSGKTFMYYHIRNFRQMNCGGHLWPFDVWIAKILAEKP